VYVEDVEREVREARAQHANHNYEVAVDLIQDAISTALERQQDLETARREFQKRSRSSSWGPPTPPM